MQYGVKRYTHLTACNPIVLAKRTHTRQVERDHGSPSRQTKGPKLSLRGYVCVSDDGSGRRQFCRAQK
jgi:hypothetical protein